MIIRKYFVRMCNRRLKDLKVVTHILIVYLANFFNMNIPQMVLEIVQQDMVWIPWCIINFHPPPLYTDCFFFISLTS